MYGKIVATKRILQSQALGGQIQDLFLEERRGGGLMLNLHIDLAGVE